ncbi:carbohydrate ABC transporter permease [Catenovulum sediminis]|uniref:Sugar ABC transporter permease n=1 Tax=Catenovulum sediminis TaxID=1740262 RepID=A0ABV1RJR8_9ALTE|nr:sugar ABC transporter permease [Catenovulum sediminis]
MSVKLSADQQYQLSYTGIGNDKRQARVMLLPAIFLLAIFVLLPLLVSVGVSFTDERLLSPNTANFVGLENYKRLLSLKHISVEARRDKSLIFNGQRYAKVRDILRNNSQLYGYSVLAEFEFNKKQQFLLARDPLFIRSVLNTFQFVVMVVPIQVGLALLLALALRRNFRGALVLKLMFFAPVVMSMVVVCVIWTLMLHQQEGLINQAILSIWPDYQEIDWLNDSNWALFAIACLSAWQGVGVQMLIIIAGLQGIPKMLYEAASIDGASKWAQFRFITLPGLKQTLVFVVLSTTIFAFSLFVQVDVMTQGGPQDATSTVLYFAIEKGFRQQQIAYGATVCILYFMMILMISMLQRKLLNYAK